MLCCFENTLECYQANLLLNHNYLQDQQEDLLIKEGRYFLGLLLPSFKAA